MRSILAVFEYIILLADVICYVLSSVALYALAKRRGINHPGYSWLPVGRDWILGNIADDFDVKNGSNQKFGNTMFTLSATSVAVFFFSVMLVFAIIAKLGYALFIMEVKLVLSSLVFLLILIILLIWIAKKAFEVICIYKLFESTVSEKTAKYLLVYFMIPFAGAICLYKCRNKGYSKQCYEEFCQNETASSNNQIDLE